MTQQDSPKPPRTPKLCKHPDGRAYVRLRGKFHYLGRYGTVEATQHYHALMAQLAATGLSMPLQMQPKDLTISEGLALYLDYARGYYKNGQAGGGHIDRVRAVIICAQDLYGGEQAGEFGPLRLRAVQAELVTRGYARTNINSMVSCLRLAFKWLASHELIPATNPLALTTVPGLRAGKTTAKESEPVLPVSLKDVEAALTNLPAPVAAIVRLQLATAARPGEIVGLRPRDVKTEGDVWEIRLTEHKTAHRGKTRIVLVGPKGQEVLRPFLLRDRDAFCFNPIEANAARAAAAPTHRRPNQKPNARKTERIVGDSYDVAGYRRAVARGCRAAKVAVWSPNQLRHTAATEIRKRFGLEAAQVVLGHTKADVTQIYAEADLEKATRAVTLYG